MIRYPLTGQVLKAWDIGVLSMQKGEVSTLLCKPEYAYGSAGNPDRIPPDSSVVFEVRWCCLVVCFSFMLFSGTLLAWSHVSFV